LQLLNNPEIDFAIQNANIDAGERATGDITARVQKILGSVAPAGNKSITLTGGSNAAEQAIFEAIIERGANQRYSVLGFEGQCHGDSLVFAQFAHPSHSMSLGWPTIAYPTSASAEEQSLSAVKKALDQKREQGNPVAAIIIEPTNSSTGH
jgi:4-aminobutyrate aminotransferase-like enzyme